MRMKGSMPFDENLWFCSFLVKFRRDVEFVELLNFS